MKTSSDSTVAGRSAKICARPTSQEIHRGNTQLAKNEGSTPTMSLYVTKVSVNWNHDSSHMIITDSQMVEHRQMKPQTSCVDVYIYIIIHYIYIYDKSHFNKLGCVYYIHIYSQGGPPPVVNCFINPINKPYILNYSYIYHKP